MLFLGETGYNQVLKFLYDKTKQWKLHVFVDTVKESMNIDIAKKGFLIFEPKFVIWLQTT